MAIQLYEYQKNYLSTVHKNYILDAATGTGKTIMSLYHYLKYAKGKKLLIVAPASKINEGGWQRTIKQVEESENIKIFFNTCSYNMIHKEWREYKNYFVIFDECHRLKLSTGVWGRACFELTTIADGYLLLSATPIPNGWEDSINYFKIFGLVKNKTSFLREFASTQKEYYGQRTVNKVVDYKHKDKLKAMWGAISKRLNKEDCIDLPQVVEREIYFRPSKQYDIIKKHRVLEDEYFDNSMKLHHGLRLHTSLDDKIKWLVEFVNSTTQNILIFYNYNEELMKMLENLPKEPYLCNGQNKTYPKKDEWDKITNSITLANYKSGSEAVEFTYCTIVIYFSPTESYTEWYQSIGRVHRIGQDKKVTMYKFITKNTIEEDVYQSLENKQDFNYKLWEINSTNK